MGEEDEDEKWIKILEKRLGFGKGTGREKYWKHAEFEQDGLSCFYDLDVLSDDEDGFGIDADQKRKEEYARYLEMKEFVAKQNEKNEKPKQQMDAFTKYKNEQQEMEKKRQRKIEIYGESAVMDEDDIAMNEFLNESDDKNEEKMIATTNKYLPPQMRKNLIMKKDEN